MSQLNPKGAGGNARGVPVSQPLRGTKPIGRQSGDVRSRPGDGRQSRLVGSGTISPTDRNLAYLKSAAKSAGDKSDSNWTAVSAASADAALLPGFDGTVGREVLERVKGFFFFCYFKT